MTKPRFEERKRELGHSVRRLLEATAQPHGDIVRDAVIQRFEFTFELTWKTLKLYLERQGLETGGPRQTFRKAFVEGLVPTAEEGDVWMRMLEDRNLTVHTYDESLAEQIYQRIVSDYAPILQSLTARIDGLSWD